MKTRFFANVTMTAALAVAGSVAGFAMNGSMRAKIDFPFRVMSAEMPAGTYQVSQENVNGAKRFYLRNAQAQKHAIVVAQSYTTSKSERPSLTFRCVSAGCGLTAVSAGDGQSYATPSPKYRSSEGERLVTVYLDRTAGDY